MSPTERFHGWPKRAPSGRVSYVNGRYVPHREAGVHVEDRGLQLGDSVYEVFAVLNGRIRDEEEHLDRLERSVREIRMGMPMGRASLKVAMREMVRRNRVRDGFLYLQVSRGTFKRDHPIPKDSQRPTLVLTARPFDAEGAARRQAAGIAVVTRPDIRWGRRDVKTTQLLANLLAKTEAREAGGYEAWLVDPDGYVTEGASTNAWIVDRDGRLMTRGLSHAILPGVTRRVIMEAAAEAQLPVIEQQFRPADVESAREAFISSASGAAVPVIAIDGARIGDGKPGPLTRRIGELYAHLSDVRADAADRPG